MNEFLFNEKPFDIKRKTPSHSAEQAQEDSTAKPYISDLLKEMGKIRVEMLRMQKRIQLGQRQGTAGTTAPSELIDAEAGREMTQALKFLELILRDVRSIQPEVKNLHENTRTDILNEVVQHLLKVIDSFQRVFVSMAEVKDDPKMKGWFTGIEHIYNSLTLVLHHYGVEEIQCVGKQFDPKIHAAVGTLKDELKSDGIILKVGRLGFMRKGIPLRFPEVIVVKNS